MQPRGYFLFDTEINFKGLLVYSRSFEMNRQQTYRGSSFYTGWMRDTLVYDNPLSKLLQVSQITKPAK